MYDDEFNMNGQGCKEGKIMKGDLDGTNNNHTNDFNDDECLTKSRPEQHEVLGENGVEDEVKKNLNCDQDLKKFISFLPSRKLIIKAYKKIYIEKRNVKYFYINVLIEVEKTIQLGRDDEFKNICNIINYINEIENLTWLQEFYEHKSNPMKETNLIILACKHNKFNILQQLFHDENRILHNFSTAIKRNEISPRDQDNMGHTAFYYAIRDNNVDILNMLIDKWPSNYFKSSSNVQVLDDLISSAYSELKLKKVFLTKEIQFFVEHELINLRFFYNTQKYQNQNDLCTIMERIDLVVETNDLLQTMYSGKEEVDDKFIFVAGFAAQNIHVLKKQLKSTYDKLPWEEIEFCLVCFVSSHMNHQEINLIYKTILTRTSILSHLEHFVFKLKQEKSKIKEADINSGIPKIKRENAIKNIVSKHQPFNILYSNFEKIRNVYSLKKIVNYIDMALLSNAQELKGQLIIERALLVTGEFLKNTLESPNLSDDVSEILLSSGLQKDTIIILRSIRNLLSHSYSLSKRIKTEGTNAFNVFSVIQSDLKKIKTEITEILLQNKLVAVRKIIKKILGSESLEEITNLIHTYKYYKLDQINLEYNKSDEHEIIERLVKELKEKIPNKTYQQKKLFEEIDTIINSGIKNLESSHHQFSLGFVWLRIFNRANISNNDIKGFKCILKNILDAITPKVGNEGLERITHISLKLYNNIKMTHKKEEKLKILNKVSSNFKNIGELSFKILRDSKLSENKDYEKIEHLIIKIIHSSHFKVDQVPGLETLKIKYDEKKRKKYFSLKNEIEISFFNRLNTLASILKFDELKSLKLLEKFNFFENDNGLKVATEMLVFDVLEILNSSLANNQLLFDTDCPLLIGKTLRNHLAHHNALVEILPYNPLISLFLNGIKFIEEGKNLTIKSNIIGQPILDNVVDLKKRFNHNLKLIINQSEMLDALEHGSFEKLKDLINKGTEIKCIDINKRTSLHFAASGGNLKIVKFLLGNGLDVNFKDLGGQNSLCMAVRNGRMDIVNFFVEEKGLSINNVDHDGRTLLHIAAENGYKNIVEYLLKNGANTLVKDSLGFAPVHLAIINNHKDVVKTLISKDSNVDFNEVNGGCTPLLIAAEHGNLEIVNSLIKSNANVNVKNDNNWIPLHAAALNGYPEIIKALIIKGADVNTKAVNGCTPLHYAVENGSENIVEILVKYGANVNNVDKSFNTALHYASKFGNKDIIEILIKNNAHVNCENIEGMTPLHFAAQNGHLASVKTLIKSKANSNAQYAKGATPLHFAIQGNYVEVVDYLLARKANVNLRGHNNLTPLHMAAHTGNKIVVDMLIKKGANIDAISNDGHSPLSLSIIRCHIEAAEILIENGADYRGTSIDNLSLIHLAALHGCTKIVEILIKKNIHVDSIAYTGKYNITPLQCAAMNGNLNTLKVLIENGANLDDMCYNNNLTPLHFAIENSNEEVFKYLIQKMKNIDLKSLTNYMYSAVWQCNKEVVEILIENGVKPTVEILNTAVLAGHIDIIKSIINHEIDVNQIYKNTPSLMVAVFNGDKEMIKILLDKGADVNIENSLQPLFIAAYNNHVGIVSLLLKRGAKINAQSDEGMTALHIAAGHGHSSIVEILLENSANIDLIDNKNRTPLELAVAHSRFPIIKLLLEHMKVDINAQGNDNWTLLHIAAQEGNCDIVKYLIKKGANIDAKNSSGSKPIHIAAREGHINIVDLFLNVGLTVNEVGAANQTILHYAILKGQIEVVKYLIDKAIDVNALDGNGITPLHIAAVFGYEKIVQMLLNNSAVYNAVDRFHRTPIKLAKNGNVINILESTKKLFETVKFNKYLDVERNVRSGACVNAKNKGLVTPLHYASWKGYNETVINLLQNKANPNIIGKNGYSSLHYAVKFSHLEVVKSLLSNGAIYNVMDNNGKIPLDFAENNTIIYILKLIDESYKNVQNGNIRVIDDLKSVKDVDIIKAVMNNQSREGKTLMITAIHKNFPKVEKLKQLLQENVSFHLNVANHLLLQEKCQEALEIFEKIFEKRKDIFGLDSPGTLDIQNHIANVLYKQRKYQEALKILNKVYEKQIELLGINYKCTLYTKSSIALVLHRLGRNEEALKIYYDVYQRQQEILGFYDEDTLNTKLHMALVLNSLGRFDEALNTNEEVFKRSIKVSGKNSLTALAAQNNIAMVLNHQQKYEEALKTYNEVYMRKKHILGPHHSDTLRTLHNMGMVFLSQNEYDKALKAFNDVYDVQKSVLGPNHLDSLNTQNNIANVLFKQGKINAALRIFTRCLEQRKSILGDNHPDILDTIIKIKIIDNVFKLKGLETSYILEKNLYSIHIAVHDRNIEIVKDLLSSGIDINTKDNEGRTSLHFAVNNGDISIVKLLLNNGADATQATNKGNTPLHTASTKGYNEIAESLLLYVKEKKLRKLQYFIDAKTYVGCTTALHISAQKDNKELVGILLQNGACYDVKNTELKTPLNLAKFGSDTEIFLSYINKLFKSVQLNEKDKIEYLLKEKYFQSKHLRKSILQARESNGRTLIQIAEKEVAVLLLD